MDVSNVLKYLDRVGAGLTGDKLACFRQEIELLGSVTNDKNVDIVSREFSKIVDRSIASVSFRDKLKEFFNSAVSKFSGKDIPKTQVIEPGESYVRQFGLSGRERNVPVAIHKPPPSFFYSLPDEKGPSYDPFAQEPKKRKYEQTQPSSSSSGNTNVYFSYDDQDMPFIDTFKNRFKAQRYVSPENCTPPCVVFVFVLISTRIDHFWEHRSKELGEKIPGGNLVFVRLHDSPYVSFTDDSFDTKLYSQVNGHHVVLKGKVKTTMNISGYGVPFQRSLLDETELEDSIRNVIKKA